MSLLGAPPEERLVRLPKEGETCDHCGLTRDEMACLIYPCAENGGVPPLRYVSVDMPGREPVALIPWEPLHQWLMRRDPKRSYETPRAFKRWLARYPSCHLSAMPSTVIQITDLFQSGEEPQFEKAITEQESMNRAVWVLYTRKGAAVGYKKRRA